MTDNYTDTDTQTRRQFLRRGATVTVVTTLGGAALIQPGAAQQEKDQMEEAIGAGLFADDGFAGYSQATWGFAVGLTEGLEAWANRQFVGSRSYRLQDYVGDVVEEYRSHEQDWIAWVNNRDWASGARESAELTFVLDGEETTRYVLADYDADAAAYTDTTIVESWDGTPDVTAELRGPAVENAADELAMLHEKFIAQDKDISVEYASKLAGRYYFGKSGGKHISSSLLGDLERKNF